MSHILQPWEKWEHATKVKDDEIAKLKAKLAEAEIMLNSAHTAEALIKVKLAAVQADRFESYDVIRQAASGTHAIYGVRPNGTRVRLDELYLKDHDSALAAEREAHERDQLLAAKAISALAETQAKLAEQTVFVTQCGVLQSHLKAAEAKYSGEIKRADENYLRATRAEAKLAEAQELALTYNGELGRCAIDLAAEREAHERTQKDLRATNIAHEFESGCAKRFLAELRRERELVRKLREVPCCEHYEDAHETKEYRGSKNRHCLAADCECKRFRLRGEPEEPCPCGQTHCIHDQPLGESCPKCEEKYGNVADEMVLAWEYDKKGRKV